MLPAIGCFTVPKAGEYCFSYLICREDGKVTVRKEKSFLGASMRSGDRIVQLFGRHGSARCPSQLLHHPLHAVPKCHVRESLPCCQGLR